MRALLVILVAIAGCKGKGKDGGTAAVDPSCKGAACYAGLRHNIPGFAPDEGRGGYFTKDKTVYMEITDSKAKRALVLETKKPVSEGATYTIGGTVEDDGDFRLSSFGGTYGSETVEKGATLKIVSLPKTKTDPVIIEVHMKFGHEEETGMKTFEMNGVAVVDVFVGE